MTIARCESRWLGLHRRTVVLPPGTVEDVWSMKPVEWMGGITGMNIAEVIRVESPDKVIVARATFAGFNQVQYGREEINRVGIGEEGGINEGPWSVRDGLLSGQIGRAS